MLDSLVSEVLAEIASGAFSADDAHFFEWALRISKAQAIANPTLHREPLESLDTLDQLPAISTDTFRYARVACFEESRAIAAEFLTSGTTARYRGRHALYRTDIYRQSLLAGFDTLVASRVQPVRLVAMVPPYAEATESSLSFMLDALAESRFPGRATFAVGAGGLLEGSLTTAIEDASAANEPVLLFATTPAVRALLESGISVALPEGSLLLTTGGTKGRQRMVPPVSADREIAKRLGEPLMGSEYGMTELCSQAYRIGDEPFRLPAWCRVLAIDPATGRPVGSGQAGLLRFFDLANVQSAIVVQTADVGRCVGTGAFHYDGRAPRADRRGCSIAFEELAGV
jgi:hypothetical protein